MRLLPSAATLLLLLLPLAAQQARAETHMPEHDSALELLQDLDVNRTGSDHLEVSLTWNGTQLSFELERVRDLYEGAAAQSAGGADARATFATAEDAPLSAVATLLADGSLTGFFHSSPRKLVHVSTAQALHRQLGAERFGRALQAAPATFDAAGADARRYLGAQVKGMLAGACGQDEGGVEEAPGSATAADSDAVVGNILPASGLWGGSARRGLQLTAPECELPAALQVFSIGVVTDASVLDLYGGSQEELRNMIELFVSTTNMWYRRDVNVMFKLAEVLHETDSFRQVCQLTANEALTEVIDFANVGDRGTRVAHWHRISGCRFANNIVGTAMYGTMCDAWRGRNVAVTSHGDYMSATQTFAHELGHALGAPHPFISISDAGRFGGLMDYGNGELFGTDVVGFTETTSKFMCSKITDLIKRNTCGSSKLLARPVNPVCGDKVVAGAEECECPDGSKSCGRAGFRCRSCKLEAPQMECSNQFAMRVSSGPVDGSTAQDECCSDEGVLGDATTACNGGNGYCSLGQCVNRCANFFNRLDICGTLTSRGGCRQRCIHPTSGFCTGTLQTRVDGRAMYITDLDDGSKCSLSAGVHGVCETGRCVAGDAGALPDQPSGGAAPTSAPTTRRPTSFPTTAQPTVRPSASPTPRPSTAQPTTARPTTASPTERPTVPTAKPTTARPTTGRPTARPTESKYQWCSEVKTRGECCSVVINGERCHPSKNGKTWSNTVCRGELYILEEPDRMAKANMCTN